MSLLVLSADLAGLEESFFVIFFFYWVCYDRERQKSRISVLSALSLIVFLLLLDDFDELSLERRVRKEANLSESSGLDASCAENFSLANLNLSSMAAYYSFKSLS